MAAARVRLIVGEDGLDEGSPERVPERACRGYAPTFDPYDLNAPRAARRRQRANGDAGRRGMQRQAVHQCRAAWGLVGPVSTALSTRALATLKNYAEENDELTASEAPRAAPATAELRLAA